MSIKFMTKKILCALFLLNNLAALLPLYADQSDLPTDINNPVIRIVTQWDKLPLNELMVWQLCFKQPVMFYDFEEHHQLLPDNVIQQGLDYWLYEFTSEGKQGIRPIQTVPSIAVDITCSRLRYQGQLYTLGTQPYNSDFSNTSDQLLTQEVSGIMQIHEYKHEHNHESDSLLSQTYYPQPSNANHQRSVRLIPNILCPPVLTTESMENENTTATSGVPRWSALTSIATFFVVGPFSCCFVCLYFQAIQNCLHCRRGK